MWQHTMVTLTQDLSSPLSFFAPRSGGVWGGQSYWGETASSGSGDHLCQEGRRADMWWGRRDKGNKIGGRCSWCTQTLSGVTRGEHLCVRVLLLMLVTQGLWRHWRLLWTLTSGPSPSPDTCPGQTQLCSHPHTAMQWKYGTLIFSDCSDL